ncbi:MAG: sodium:proton antiporter [Firmicutes bacterium HGW-Firmicutes-7]|nr:MAG: sodium:proton antiporter [Firmicutes bacterium HGW-Firmicutes-7]
MTKFIAGEAVAIALFCIGLYGLLARRNIIKTVISIGIIESAVILYFLTIGFTEDAVPPIGANIIVKTVDPVPQALMITTIVIGVAVTAVALTMFLSLYHRYGTTNWKKVIKKRGEEE